MSEPISQAMRDRIQIKLSNIETQFDIQIILAVESGSRAWGFASPNSDYDVRFIYKRPQDYYLKVFPTRDVIDGQDIPITPIDDYVGWDIKKALTLMEKGNPQLNEWLNSPIVYKRNEADVYLINGAAEQYFSPHAAQYHYLHMARGNIHEFLEHRTTLPMKKYFYILRPLLVCLWMEHNPGPPPVEFEALLTSTCGLSDRQRVIVLNMLEDKRTMNETGVITRSDYLDAFISWAVDHIDTRLGTLPALVKPPVEFLDQAFRDIIS